MLFIYLNLYMNYTFISHLLWILINLKAIICNTEPMVNMRQLCVSYKSNTLDTVLKSYQRIEWK